MDFHVPVVLFADDVQLQHWCSWQASVDGRDVGSDAGSLKLQKGFFAFFEWQRVHVCVGSVVADCTM